MPRPEKSASAVRPEGAASTGHFLSGIYFVPMPDFSDETVWTINQGRAMPALIAVLRALHDQHRRGRTAEIRSDAEGGRLTIGLKALSRANGMQTSSFLRQLRFLERAGILKAHEGERVVERDPQTGKILKGRGRTPPKVIVMTLDRSMMRGGRRSAETGRIPSQKPEETGRIPSLSHHALRDGKRPPSIENPTKGFPMENSEGNDHPAQGGRSVHSPQAQREPAVGREAEERAAEEETRRQTTRILGERFAKGLGITLEEVGRLWKANPTAFRERLTNAGINPQTGKATPLIEMIDRPAASAFAIRRQTTASLAVCPSVAGEAAQALDGPPVSDEERRAVILRDLAKAGLTAGKEKTGAA